MGVSGSTAGQVESGGEAHRALGGLGDGAAGVVDADRIDLRAAGSLEPRLTGELTDHRHGALRRERKQLLLVLQQHGRPDGRLPGQLVVGAGLGRRAGRRCGRRWVLSRGTVSPSLQNLLDQSDDPGRAVIQHGFLQLPGAQGLEHPLPAEPTGGGHLQVQAGLQRLGPVGYGEPV